jgi:glycerate 2-kinase
LHQQRRPLRALAAPASLKGALSAREAAAALAEGLGGAEECPVADGGEGTLDVLRDYLPEGVAAVEAAEAIGLGVVTDDVMAASSRPLGERIKEVVAARPDQLIVFLGGTGTVDGGAGLLEVLDELPVPTRAACDVRATLLDAVWVFAAQKGATRDQLPQLERRLLEIDAIQPYRDLPGAGAAGGLGAALASLGAQLVEGAPLVLDLIGFRERVARADLVVTGEGTVDRSTFMGKAPSAVLDAAKPARCVLFGGRVLERPPEIEVYELSGDPTRAREDLVALGARLSDSARTS